MFFFLGRDKVPAPTPPSPLNNVETVSFDEECNTSVKLSAAEHIIREKKRKNASHEGGTADRGDDENASRRDDKGVPSALTNASIKKLGRSKKKRGVVGLTLVGVAAGVFVVSLYYENRKTVRAEAKAEAAYLADYNGPWYYDEECLSLHERARNLKGDVKTSSATVLINRKGDEEVEESKEALGIVNIFITSGPKPKGVPGPEAEPIHPEYHRKCTERDSVYGTRIESSHPSGGADFAEGPEKKAEVQKKTGGVKAKSAKKSKVAKSKATKSKSKASKKSKATKSKSKASKKSKATTSKSKASKSSKASSTTSPSRSPSKAPRALRVTKSKL